MTLGLSEPVGGLMAVKKLSSLLEIHSPVKTESFPRRNEGGLFC